MIYVIETPNYILWSKSKMTAQYKHVEFMRRDRARFKSIPGRRLAQLLKSPKPVSELP